VEPAFARASTRREREAEALDLLRRSIHAVSRLGRNSNNRIRPVIDSSFILSVALFLARRMGSLRAVTKGAVTRPA